MRKNATTSAMKVFGFPIWRERWRPIRAFFCRHSALFYIAEKCILLKLSRQRECGCLLCPTNWGRYAKGANRSPKKHKRRVSAGFLVLFVIFIVPFVVRPFLGIW